jgi:hypothetical protein
MGTPIYFGIQIDLLASSRKHPEHIPYCLYRLGHTRPGTALYLYRDDVVAEHEQKVDPAVPGLAAMHNRALVMFFEHSPYQLFHFLVVGHRSR